MGVKPPPPPPPAPAPEPRPKLPPGTITIHVFDEAKLERRDFYCDLQLLLREMRYFRAHLGAARDPRSDVAEMSVHCDADVFEWLLDYVKATAARDGPGDDHPGDDVRPGDDVPPVAPELTVGNCVSVLVSSDFLRMDRLVEECLDFVTANAVAVARGPLDLGALAERLLRRLAARLTEDTLEALRDAGDAGTALSSKLYGFKLEQFAESRSATSPAARCVACGRLYSAAHRSKLVCPRARVYVDFHGDVVARHVPSRRFDLHAHVRRLVVDRNHDPRDVYWHVWGALHVLPRCATCRAHVPASELGHCLYHPTAATFDRGSNEGTHGCCGARALRFDAVAAASLVRGGCRAREHVLRPPRGGAYGAASHRERASSNPSAGVGVVHDAASEAWEAAQWILSATRRHHALVVEPHGFGPATAPATPLDAAVAAAMPPPPPHGCVNGVYLARDHHAVEFEDADEDRRRRLFSDGDFAESEACRAGADEDEDTDGSSDGDGWGGVGVWAPAPPMRASAHAYGYADAGRGSDANANANASRSSGSSSSSSAASFSSDGGASTDDESATRATRRKKPSSSGFPALTKIAPRGTTPQRMGRRAAAAAAGTGRVSWAKTGIAATKNKPATAGKLSRRKKNAHAGKSRSIEPSAYGLPRETYEALPEHLKRSIRRDALKEEDDMRTAALISRLRMRRTAPGEAAAAAAEKGGGGKGGYLGTRAARTGAGVGRPSSTSAVGGAGRRGER